MISDWIRKRVTDYTPGVGRVFLACRGCERVVPYYKLYGKGITTNGCPHCGHLYFQPKQIAEVYAAWLLLWAYVTKQGDPRMAYRKIDSKYA